MGARDGWERRCVMYNKVLIIGHLGRDPEMRYTPNGQAVTDFSVASSRRYTAQDGERREETDWFRISAWGQLGEQCNQYLGKGSLVYVEVLLHVRQYQASDGTVRVSCDVMADEVRFLTPRPADGSASEGAPGGP